MRGAPLAIMIAIGAALLPAQTAEGLNWQYEVVGADGHNPSMALDLSGNLHIAYVPFVGQQFKHAAWDGQQWVIQPVAEAGVVSLAVDAQGWPHVAYVTPQLGTSYAWHDGMAWQTEPVAGYMHVGPSLALDGAGVPHVAIWDNDLVRTRYAVRDGGTWPAETVGPTGMSQAFSGNCLAFGPGGVPHIAGSLSGSLATATPGQQGWDVETITPGAGGASLVFDADGHARVAHAVANDDVLKYTWWDGSQWQTQLVDDSGRAHIWGNEALALDSRGYPHICYFYRTGETGGGSVNYAGWNGQAWDIETVAVDVSGGGYRTSIVIDPTDHVHVAYADLNTLELVHAWALIPEPAALSLLALGGVAVFRRRHK